MNANAMRNYTELRSRDEIYSEADKVELIRIATEWKDAVDKEALEQWKKDNYERK